MHRKLPSRAAYAAFENLYRIRQRKGRCYLWTFTFKRGVYDRHEASEFWGKFQDRLKAAKKLVPMHRVIEWHPGGHGIHFHGVTEQRHDVVWMRQVWQAGWGKSNGGRVHVKRVPRTKAIYIAKYLAKQRVPQLKGAKLYHICGKSLMSYRPLTGKDCYYDTSYSRCARYLWATSRETFLQMTYAQRQAAVRAVYASAELNLATLGILPEYERFGNWQPGHCIRRESQAVGLEGREPLIFAPF